MGDSAKGMFGLAQKGELSVLLVHCFPLQLGLALQ